MLQYAYSYSNMAMEIKFLVIIFCYISRTVSCVEFWTWNKEQQDFSPVINTTNANAIIKNLKLHDFKMEKIVIGYTIVSQNFLKS